MAPTYMYEREDGSLFELYQSFEDEKLKECPKTGQPVKRLISGGIEGGNKITGQRTSLKDKKRKIGDKGTSLSDYGRIQQRQRKRYQQKQENKKQ